MATKPEFPYRFITGLPPKAQQEIWRDFEYLATAIANASLPGFDVYVDRSLTTDNPGTRTFTTPFKAIAYAADTLGKAIISVGWIYSGLDSGSLPITEASNYSGTRSGLQIHLSVIGETNFANNKFGLTSYTPVWDFSTFTDSGKFQYLHVNGIEIKSSLTTAWATSASFAMFMENGKLNGGAPLPAGIYHRVKLFNGTRWHTVGSVWAWGCSFDTMSTATNCTKNFYAFDCFFGAMGSQTITAQEFVADGCVFSTNGDGMGGSSSAISGVSSTLTWSGVGNTTRIHIASVGESGTANQALAISIPAGAGYVWLEGKFWSVTLGAVAGSGAGGGLGTAYLAGLAYGTTCDITGPVVLNFAMLKSGSTIRGEGITGSLSVWGATSSGTALSMVGIHDSAFTLSFQKYSDTPSSGKAYSIDAASSNSIIIEAGDSLFPSASSNASSSVTVLTHSGVSGFDTTAIHSGDAATPWFAGTYPTIKDGPDFTHDFLRPPAFIDRIRNMKITATPPTANQVLTWDATNHILKWATAGSTDPSAIHTGDSAGPWMAGTFPSPQSGPDFTKDFLFII